MHYLALIVTQEKVEMWVDAQKKFEGSLKRPVTDCSGTALEIGVAHACCDALRESISVVICLFVCVCRMSVRLSVRLCVQRLL